MSVSERNKFKLPILDSDGWLTPEDVARVLPNTSAKSVREWCAAGKLAGAVQLPNQRWQIPWVAVVKVLGYYVGVTRAAGSLVIEPRAGSERRRDFDPGVFFMPRPAVDIFPPPSPGDILLADRSPTHAFGMARTRRNTLP